MVQQLFSRAVPQWLAMGYRWPREDWAVFLVPYLTGKTRSAYEARNMDHATDYNRMKEAII